MSRHCGGHGTINVVKSMVLPSYTGGRGGTRVYIDQRKTVLQSRFGAFVYSVLPLQTDMKAKECTQIDENRLSVSFRGIRVRCYNTSYNVNSDVGCDASYSVNCDASCDVNCV